MSAICCHSSEQRLDKGYRRILWIVLVINGTMFVVEVISGLAAGSVSLQADALDFLADSMNYGMSLLVVGRALHQRARVALVKGVTMGLLGFWILAATSWSAVHRTLPEAVAMGGVGLAALLANGIVFGLLWAYRSGDSDMQSVWLCARNDVLENCAVLLAALGVFGTGTGWPDLIVATVMAGLALQAAWLVVRRAHKELIGTNA